MTRKSLACGEKKDCEKSSMFFQKRHIFLTYFEQKQKLIYMVFMTLMIQYFLQNPLGYIITACSTKLETFLLQFSTKMYLWKNIFYFLFSDPRSSITPNLALIEVGPSIKASDSSHGIASKGNAHTNVLCKMNITHLIL